ncbi:MAG: antibiotic biosynthesis monooxygenase [Gammaproteobacteria bacterium]|nr:antibiotic biosynthesis monooxygenase [Gammaproteobacteria bacterium]
MTETDNRVYLNGYIDVPIDRLADVSAALPKHIELTRAEPGCVSFEITASDTVEGRLNVAEVFIDQAAFDVHQARTKASDWFKTTEGIPREYSITVGNK